MLQRCLRQSSRAVSVAATEARISQAQRTTFQASQSLARAQRRSFVVSRRHFAEAEPVKADGEAAAPGPSEEAQPEAQKEDPIAKELEAKKREALDLTVCQAPFQQPACCAATY